MAPIRYKIVFRTKKGLWSAVAYPTNLRTQYLIKEWVSVPERPDMLENHYLCVFNNFDNAQKFAAIEFVENNADSYEIYQCLVKGRHHIKRLPIFYKYSIATGMWEPVYGHAWPEGTEMWEYVKLTEKVFDSFKVYIERLTNNENK